MGFDKTWGTTKMVSFEFAYDNPVFSDRVLQLELTAFGDQAYEVVEKSEELHGGRREDGSELSITSAPEILHVNSAILAAHSDYFMRMFSNGMSESSSGVAVVHVSEEEKFGLRQLIEYMYTGRLSEPQDVESTITLLCLADRFAISSCMEPLARVLKRFPNTSSDCLLVLGLPESLKAERSIQPVVEHCRSYLASQFQDISSKKGDFLSLSIEGVKVILDSDALMVAYEEEVFQILLDWIEANCRTPDEKQVAVEEVAGVIRFPWMTGDFLIDVVSTNPQMQSTACQALLMEALRFKSFTHARQQQMLWKKTNHNRYRPRNNTILENFWGNSKTFQVKQPDGSCQVLFEFPLELVICTGQSFQSRTFYLCDKYAFYLEARHGQVKTSYNQQLTCFVNLILPPRSETSTNEDDQGFKFVDYTIAMKRDYSQNYDTKTSGSFYLTAAEAAGVSISFTDFFSGWGIERGFSVPRWNLTINGPVFLKLDLKLRIEAFHELDGQLQARELCSPRARVEATTPVCLVTPDTT
ncbi:hypothetical protein KC19_8G032600 [Ceratodon purpureus]|uniref:BTB domain-containing protein n=1 Tax=Ceratodon purpureus TaxID=3225 RepID=A0A8T0H2W4_CERPU|nr:hypothetical protein KC19_8G032600 [Ceratodon purpureus]